ncbi:hypothetical protein [Thomasclavelia spiroformis]|uniref:hypothetical protein n=1 Tax=Thomasclavelia spiroformis TaxID=29348 RepID=UPI00399A47EE
MKKTKYLLITTVLIMLISGVSNINAYNENANDENDESTLDLNTGGLKNKKEDYSSLTDINGINIFTDEANKAIDEKNINEKEKWDEAKNKLFTPNYQTKDDEKNINDNLFKEPVVFNKIFTNQQTKISFVWIIVCLTVVLGICVFIFTRRFYKRKGELENEDNSYTYQ